MLLSIVVCVTVLGSEYPDLPSAEMREQMLPLLAKQNATITYADLSRIITAMYPTKSAIQEASAHPSGELGLKDDQEKTPGCKEIVEAKKANPTEFNFANQVSSKFPEEFAKCSHDGGAVCALKIWSDKCI